VLPARGVQYHVHRRNADWAQGNPVWGQVQVLHGTPRSAGTTPGAPLEEPPGFRWSGGALRQARAHRRGSGGWCHGAGQGNRGKKGLVVAHRAHVSRAQCRPRRWVGQLPTADTGQERGNEGPSWPGWQGSRLLRGTVNRQGNPRLAGGQARAEHDDGVPRADGDARYGGVRIVAWHR